MDEYKMHMIMKSFSDFESSLCWLNHSINDCVEFIEDDSLISSIKQLQAPVKQMYLAVVELSQTVVNAYYNEEISDKEKVFVFNLALNTAKRLSKDNFSDFAKQLNAFANTIESDLIAKKKLVVSSKMRCNRVTECLNAYEERIKDFTLKRTPLDMMENPFNVLKEIKPTLTKKFELLVNEPSKKQKTLTLVK